MRILAIAGEVSGDTHGGALLSCLLARLPGLEAVGIGGPRMEAAGLKTLFPLEALQVHGLLEVLAHLPRLYRILWALERILDDDPPDALLLIDYPGFNLKLAAAAKKRGIPVYYYCSPQVWAWRRGRIKTIAQVVDLMIVLFPFEAPLYREAGLEAVFLGHPLVRDPKEVARGEQAAGEEPTTAMKRQLEAGPWNSDEEGTPLPVVALMPGSRPSEMDRHLEVLLDSVRLIEAEGFHARWVLPVAPTLDERPIKQAIEKAGVPVLALEDAFEPLLALADLALVASGTATLQTAMSGVPFLVIYRVAPLTYFLARRLATLPHLSIVNILAGREVVPELLQGDFTPERVRDAFLALARDNGSQAAMRGALGEVTAQLGAPGAYGRAAQLLADRLTGQKG